MRKCGSAMIGPNRYPGQARRISGALVLFPIFAILVGLLVLAAKSERTQAQGSAQALPSVKVAFIADTGITANAVAVLQLIRDQNADFVLHQGDFGYFEGDPAAAPVWDDQLNAVLGADYPYFGSIGNIDVNAWPAYRELLVGRLNRIPDAVCQGDYGVNASCHYKGIFFILSGVGTMGSDHVQFIEDELSKDNSAWRICTWHKVQQAMQLGDKPDEVGWGAYEACREGGAIIATGHEHSYSRTRTLTDIEHQVVDPNLPDPNDVRVIPGSTFVFVSGLGGKGIGSQQRCLPTTYPYGCNGEWASIYTSDQGAKYGALFIEFNLGGDPNKARGQFINVDGEVIDDFMVTAVRDNTPPTGDDQQITTAPDTARTITLTGSDPEGDPLTFTVLNG
ncbi:MAG TPA: metallophosphoesterase, partial [Dehalococcoidia bacterium]|nr:metallophosphoesterase [Dehalococcoidia bacterium]